MTPRAPEKNGATLPMLAGGFLLLALIVALTVVFAGRERANNAYAEQALKTEDALSDMFSTMREGENGSRGYLITGNAYSLATLNQALQNAPLELAALDAVLAQGDEAIEMANVRMLTDAKLAQLETIKARLLGGDKAGAAALINIDLNRRTMIDLRELVDAMRAEEERHLAAADARAVRDGWLLQGATAMAVLGTILLALYAVRANRLQTESLRRAEAALLAANEVLERRVAERTATLNASEARFRSLSETLPSLVYMTDSQGGTVYVNPQFAAYTGLPAAAHMGQGWTGSVHPDDLQTCLELWSASLRFGTHFEVEYRLRRHDGVYRWFLDRAVPLRGAEGAISAWIGSSTDIEERKAAEAAMAGANAELERRVTARSAELDRIFRLSTDILTAGTFDGRFTAVNPAWERITGRPAAEATSLPYTAFVHPEDLAHTEAAFAELVAGKPVSVINRYRRADGSFCWLSWSAVVAPEEQKIYCVARDITAEREREEQLRQSQKMEVVGQLTGGVAHDFNNLLTIILGSLELLQRGLTGADPKFTRRVEAAMEAARRAAALTHRLLAFSRRQPLAPKPLEINRLLAGMSDMLHRTLGETIEVEFVSGAGLWPAIADANQLENALLNLAVNARDAMPGGGQLTIETQNTFLDEVYAAAREDVAPGQYVMIAVSDTGSGMASEVRARVFEPFFTTKPAGQGTGLGLAQVYGFIKQSGGHVSVYSEPGQGTTVKLFLPRHRRALAEEEVPPPEPAPAPARGETVLVVEDEPGVLNFSAEVLRDLGYHVLTAETAAAALSLFSGNRDIDMLFTDVVLAGGMNGRQLADEVLRQNPRVIVLFTTGYTRNAIIHHGRLDDGVQFIGKPFTATALGDKVGKLFEHARVKG